MMSGQHPVCHIEEILLSSDESDHDVIVLTQNKSKMVEDTTHRNHIKQTEKIPDTDSLSDNYFYGDLEFLHQLLIDDECSTEEPIKNEENYAVSEESATDIEIFYDTRMKLLNKEYNKANQLKVKRNSEIRNNFFLIAEEIGHSEIFEESFGNSAENINNKANIENLRIKTDNCDNTNSKSVHNSSSDDEYNESINDKTEVMSMPSKWSVKGFRFRGKRFLQMFCNECDRVKRCGKRPKDKKFCKPCRKMMIFQCKQCSSLFPTYHKAFTHLKRKCASKSFWQCPECAYTVMTESKLEAHIKRVHVGINSNQFLHCNKCNKVCKTQESMRKHIQLCLNPSKFHCELCDYKSNWVGSIRKHLNNVHSEMNGGYLKALKDGMRVRVNLRPALDIPINSQVSMHKKDVDEQQIILENSINLYCCKCDLSFEKNHNREKKCKNCEGLLLWQCTKCKNLSKSYCGLYDHVKNRCKYICSKCNQILDSVDSGIAHEKLCAKKYRSAK